MAGRPRDDQALSSGVDALITRLRDEGVSAGREEADRILLDARTEAKRTLDKANVEAKDRLEAARREADAYRSAGEEALKTAMRDTVLAMKSTLTERFGEDVKRLIAHHLQDPDVLKRMILEIAGRARDDADIGDGDDLTILLPEKVAGLEELRADPEALREGPLTRFVLGITGDMLRDGVTFEASDASGGIRVQVEDKAVILELTEEAVASLLLQHLQPRFRTILEGIVK